MLHLLQQTMKEKGIDAYIIPTNDPHDTEYVCDHFAVRKAFSGFTGSAGTLVVLQDNAYCWTDGRYYIQAQKELEPFSIQLMKAGMAETPTIVEFLMKTLSEGCVVAYDGKVCSATMNAQYQSQFKKNHIEVLDIDLISDIWKDRPALPQSQTFFFPIEYSGKSIQDKVHSVQTIMKEKECSHMIVTKVDEVAWLFNLRAHDIPSFPVALAYAKISYDSVTLYIDSSRLDTTSFNQLQQAGVIIKGYLDIYEECKTLTENTLVDFDTINSTLYQSIRKPIHSMSPIISLKAIKNEVEITNTKKAHIKDGVAVCKFMFWLYHTIGKDVITELDAQHKLQSFRQEQDLYIEDSFTTISAYGAHGSMMHYSATPKSNIQIQAKGLYLVDSGAHYMDGTTDITRTFVMGPLTNEEKKWFTLALKGHIHLSDTHFLYGMKGSQLDILAREPLWKEAMDYQCGTGHGVGHVLSVHEGNNGFRSRITEGEAILDEGMITSNEPGVYIENQFGIRHENEILVVKDCENEYGRFLKFEPLTWVPFCKEGLDLSLLNEEEIVWINTYHQNVYNTISPYLERQEATWLQEVCSPIVK